MSLEGRVALVTGGGRGIGRAISMGLAEDGAAVAVNYRRDEDAAHEAVAAIEAAGGRAKAYHASVDSFEEDQAMVEAILKDFGHVDILVNNAGIASRGQSVADTDPAEMERVVRTHAFGPHYLSKLVLPSMREQPRGDIVMISSAATKNFAGNGAPYNMGKAAMEALALTLYKEERKNSIHVNIVAPGLVETEMGKRLARATTGVQDIHELDARSPFSRVCQPEDIANVVRFVVSDRAGYVTGERIYVDGGGNLFNY
ncbi:MAG TPA: SDR family oxidoreductase [Tepidiformaceae bacterium]|nr:SDR family oxidoreductase [Tepidiformaceae bacterium]